MKWHSASEVELAVDDRRQKYPLLYATLPTASSKLSAESSIQIHANTLPAHPVRSTLE
jgi:hypothetical protein